MADLFSSIQSLAREIAAPCKAALNASPPPPPSLQAALQDVADLADAVAAIDSSSASFTSIASLLAALGKTISALEQVTQEVKRAQPLLADADDLVSDLVSLLLTRAAAAKAPKALELASVLGLTSPTSNLGPRVFELSTLLSLLSDPARSLVSVYSTTRENLTTEQGALNFSAALFPRIVRLLRACGIDASYTGTGGDPGRLPSTLPHEHRALVIPFTPAGPVGVACALTVDSQGNPALALAPVGTGESQITLDGWTVSAKLAMADGPLLVGVSGIRDSAPDVRIDAQVVLESKSARLGTNKTGTRVEIGGIRLSLEVSASDAEWTANIELAAEALSLVIGSDASDGFLQRTLPSGQQASRGSFSIGWDTSHGLHLGKGAELSVRLPLTAGDSITIAVSPSSAATDIYARLAIAVVLGPVRCSVDGIGVALSITNPGVGGNLGAINLASRVVSPSGLGLQISAGAITGGGVLQFDPEHGRYTGIVLLSLYSIQVKAIGLLDTKVPGGGYSFLILISVEFNPIQIGFGFTLNGIGGLGGINRSFVVETLQTGLRQHSLDHILFPKDPIKNAPAIISDLRNIFPAADGHYVFGPILELAWGGAVNLVTAELGVLLVLPAPLLIVVLGQIHVNLPKPNAPVVDLHLDVLGVIDFGKKLFFLDATLHDSRIVAFAVYGDIAMRLSWGDNPNFALSIGGLNPHYQPPAGFPTLKRLTLALKSTDNFRLTIQTYFAITSNTFQLGAQAELYIGVGAFNVYGWLGFDALIHFDPFSFIVDFMAGLALRSGTSTVLGISLDGELSGPTPWHAKGSAHVSVLFFEISVHVDITWGEQPSKIDAPRTDAWPQLHDAITNVGNWSGALPPSAPSVVTLARPPTDTTATVLVDPNGVLTMRERVLPLNQTLTKFGEAVPGPQNTFTLDHVSLGGQVVPFTVVRDKFAPAQFEAMSDQDKLSRPSFEVRDAGFTIGDGQIKVGTSFGRDIAFEDIYVDDKAPPPTPTPPQFKPTVVLQLLWALSNAAVNSALRALAMGKYAPPPTANQLITFQDEQFVVATTSTVAQRTDITSPVSKGEAYQALAAHLSTHPGERGQLQIVPLYEVSS